MGKMDLVHVKKGRLETPLRVVIYGVDKVGKTTFASDAPSPVFLGTESGSSELDVARMPQPQTWGELLEGVEALISQDHTHRTLAIDSLDWIEPLCWARLCETKLDGQKRCHSIEDYGYQKGYIFALDVWKQLLTRLEALRERRKMNIVLIGHSVVSTFKNPEGDDYSRYSLKIHEKAAALFREWADDVLFATYESLTVKANEKAKAKGVTGTRVLYTERRAAFDAGNRHRLPEQIPLSWAAFVEAIAQARQVPGAEVREQIEELLRSCDASVNERARALLVAAGDDPAKVATIHNRLKLTVEQNQEKKAS